MTIFYKEVVNFVWVTAFSQCGQAHRLVISEKGNILNVINFISMETEAQRGDSDLHSSSAV